MSSNLPASWDSARRKTRTLESTIDAKLIAYSRLASSIPRSETGAASSSGDHTAVTIDDESQAQRAEHESLEVELERLLSQLSNSISSLTSILDDPSVPPTTTQLHAVQRHREVLLDYERDFRRTKTNVRHALDRRDLLGSVRGDIDAYKTQHASTTDALLAERGHIDNSHQMIDGTLEQAYATRADMASQRSMLSDVSARLGNTAMQVPGLNSVISLIGSRRRRDSIIMGCLIACCTLLLLMFMFR